MKKLIFIVLFIAFISLFVWIWPIPQLTPPSTEDIAERSAIWAPYYLLALRPEIYNGVKVRVIGRLSYDIRELSLSDLADYHPYGLPLIHLEYDERISLTPKGEIEQLLERGVSIEGVFYGGFSDSCLPHFWNRLVIVKLDPISGRQFKSE